ncbi:MAG: FAD-dependent oxidoreductase [Puniceicoccales bacterium]|nr:FAD-dependent oxidoreductase [Puniceicoccales bacterium]
MATKKEQIIVLGSGCAGLAAAIYASRGNLNPLVIEGNRRGGQLITTEEIENFPGFPDGIGGYELVERMRSQAEKFGARFSNDHILSMACAAGEISLRGSSAVNYATEALIIATGTDSKCLEIPGEVEYGGGKGVSVCATCDGPFFRGKEVAVIGGGDTALGEALFLSRICKKVYLIHRRDSFRGSKIMDHRVRSNAAISILLSAVVEEILGNGAGVTGIRLRNVGTEERKILPCSGVFIAAGHAPNSSFAAGILPLDSNGYFVASDEDPAAATFPGIFLAGDCADPAYQQAVIAAGTGARAAIAAERWLSGKS